MLSATAPADHLMPGEYDTSRILVHFRDAGAAKSALANTTVGSRVGLDDALREVRLGRGVDVETALTAYRNSPLVDYAEPNRLFAHASVSNDPYYTNGSLWGMDGDTTAPANTYASQAAEAWADQAWDTAPAAGNTDPNQVYVGVIDEGIDYTHPDLADNAWTNPYDPVDGVDNDGNGYVDDAHGWDFVDNDATIYDGTSDDHGTHVTGTIAAEGGNGIGVAGVDWRVKYISGKFLGPNGGSTLDAIRALDYFTDLKTRHGMNIVATNNSWGGGDFSQALLDAIGRAAKANILFITAAGNGGTDQVGDSDDATPYYPADYDTTAAAGYDSVISVAALASDGSLASFSNYGATTVNLAAPGVHVLSTLPGGGYGYGDGTSMATPHVTGAAALYAATHPGANAVTIRNAILDAARLTPTASLAGKTATGGRLDVYRTLQQSDLPSAPSGVTVTPLSSTQLRVDWADNAANETGFAIQRKGPADADFVEVGRVAANVTTFTDAGLQPSTAYAYRVVAYNVAGSSAPSAEAGGTTKAADATTPNAPSGLLARAASATQVNLTWTDNAGDETGFRVDRSTDPSFAAAATTSVNVAENATSYASTGLSASTTYYFRVVAYNAMGNSAAATASERTFGTGTGLTGKYYDSNSRSWSTPPSQSTAFASNLLKLTRTDAQVNFNWGTGSPASKVKTADTFAVRWTGQLETRYNEAYTFSMESDDGMRVWVDGKPVLDYWFNQWVKRDSAPITLTAGRHNLQVDYYENTSSAVASLLWSSASEAKQVIPKSQLYPTTTAPIYAASLGTFTPAVPAGQASGPTTAQVGVFSRMNVASDDSKDQADDLLA
jgi:subtilisin family serine protease